MEPTRPTDPLESDFQAAPPLEEHGFEEGDMVEIEDVDYEPVSTDPSIASMERSIFQSYLRISYSPKEAAEAAKVALARRLSRLDIWCEKSVQNGVSPEQAQMLRRQSILEFTELSPIDQLAQVMMDALMDRGLSYEDALEIVNEELVGDELLEEIDEELRKAEEEAKEEAEEQEEEEREEEDDEEAENEKKKKALMARIRIVPASPSYFTGKPNFTDDLISLKALLRKYQLLPVFPPGQAPRVAWKSVEQYKAMVGAEPVKSARYHRLLEILKRLNAINSAIVPEEVSDTLARYKRAVDLSQARKKQGYVNADGVSLGVGRRKTSTARAYVVEGEGEVLVNGKSLTQFFARLHDRASAVWALKATERVDKYNVFALVKGGGATGQAEAMTLAVAKALLVHEPLLKPALRRAGCVTRDPRKVERKKPGHLKARKKPAWVKR
ncbi:GTP-binding protein [Venturia nashicola]|nr:GTP-binding protein [Venturia nashicola]